jgi:hypothetical protein
MKLEPDLVARIEAQLTEAKKYVLEEVVARFIRHENRFVKIIIESHKTEVTEFTNSGR